MQLDYFSTVFGYNTDGLEMTLLLKCYLNWLNKNIS